MAHGKKSTNRNKNSTYDENIYLIMTKEDKYKLDLLYTQLMAQYLFLIARFYLFESTFESIDIIYNKYNNLMDRIPNPDIPAVKASYIYFIGQLIVTQVGFERFNQIYTKYINGEIDYSIQPDIDINIANILSIIADYYYIVASEGIYDRDLDQPIFGI